MIKAGGEAILIYTLACFKLLETFLEELYKIMMSFWWGQCRNERKLAWISWNKMCEDNGEGGLGYKDLRAKHCWRINSNLNSLFYKVLKGKYFRIGDIMIAKVGSNLSWA